MGKNGQVSFAGHYYNYIILCYCFAVVKLSLEILVDMVTNISSIDNTVYCIY